MNSRYRLPSFVVFALSSIIRHLSPVLCALGAFVVNLPAPSDSGLPLVAGMTEFAGQTTDQRRPTTAHQPARPSTVVRLPSSLAPDA
jgi:hypothetical protein